MVRGETEREPDDLVAELEVPAWLDHARVAANVQGGAALKGSAVTELSGATAEGRGLVGRLDAAIRRRAAAYRESRGINVFERSDPSLPAPVEGRDYIKLAEAKMGKNLGATSDQGYVVIRGDLEGEKLIVSARHEVAGHRTWVPDAAPQPRSLQELMDAPTTLTRAQEARRWLLEHVRTANFIDEVRAHRIATGDLRKGLLYAAEAGHLTTRVVAEGTIAGIGVAGGVYVVGGGGDEE